jgi:hypothetical protein
VIIFGALMLAWSAAVWSVEQNYDHPRFPYGRVVAGSVLVIVGLVSLIRVRSRAREVKKDPAYLKAKEDERRSEEWMEARRRKREEEARRVWEEAARRDSDERRAAKELRKKLKLFRLP